MAKVARLDVNRTIAQGDLNPVGMVVASMLTEVQFQALNGISWVLAAGQSVAGSSYATVTGNSTAPDLRGRTIAGVDNMGGSAANRLTSAGSGITATTIGNAGGAEIHTLTEGQLASHTHVQNSHSHNMLVNSNGGESNYRNINNGYLARVTEFEGWGYTYSSSNGTNSVMIQGQTPTNQNTGSNAAHQNTQPTIVMNYFIKIN